MESVAGLRVLLTDVASLMGFDLNFGAPDSVGLGVMAVALVMFFERFVMVIPSPVLLSGLGVLAAQGGLDPFACYVASVAGSFAGASVWYAGGRALRLYGRLKPSGRPPLEAPGAWKGPFEARAFGLPLATIASQCVPTVRLLAPIVAGLGRVDWLRQAPFLLIGCGVWNAPFFFIGYQISAW